MDLKYKIATTLLVALLLIVAPATAYTNVNTPYIYHAQSDANAVKTATKSVWFSPSGPSNNTVNLLAAISDSAAHGLNPQNYLPTSLEQEIKSFVANSENSNLHTPGFTSKARAKIEKKLFEVFTQLAEDLGRGVLDAQATQRSLYRAPPEVDTIALIDRLNAGEATVSELLTELAPSTPSYTKLVAHMRTLLKDRDNGVTRTPVYFIKGLKKEAEHKSIIDLRTRLVETGDLADNSSPSLYFDQDVEDALKSLQSRYGLTANGQLTEDTVVALNRSIDKDIAEVAMNLERWRWMPRELGERHIMINVPAYTLEMMNGEQKIIDMAVVVGSKKHPTPVFSKGAEIIEVAPTWTVPASITNNELIPMERERPGYLESERMDFYTWSDGKMIKVPRSQVTAADFETTPFPYILRQRAGKDNALGDIKILMPNKYAIYMHDTQAKNLFAKTDRAYSHGCIRLSDPFRLGSMLLQLDGKSPEETQSIIDQTKTTRVNLKTKTPTHITYFTAWIDEDGKLNQRKDVYKHNKRLLDGLEAKKTLISTLKNRPNTILAEQKKL